MALYYPYTDHFPDAVTLACVCTAAALTASSIVEPLPRRSATWAFGVAVWVAALCPGEVPHALHVGPNGNLLVLQASATVLTLSAFLARVRGVLAAALLAQLCTGALGLYLRGSAYDLVVLQLVACGVVLGVARRRTSFGPRLATPVAMRPRPLQDIGIFIVSVVVVALASRWTFGGFIFNGDEVANTFQADVYGHLRAYAPVPPCPSMFENYWVFRHEGRVFSQYTPGWPLFMAPFQRLGIIDLAGPTMAGLLAIAIARLSRRVAGGLGSAASSAERIVTLAGPVGAASALLGPSMLMNGASRFSHTMVCACFAWAVESVCTLATPGVAARRAWGYGLLLGAATSLGLATRPADGGLLGLAVFCYFVAALVRRRLPWRGFAGTAVAFLLFAGLTAVILRLQLGAWFKTGYSVTPSVHPEGELKLSAPAPDELRIAIPLAVGAYCWWPASFALALSAYVKVLQRPERRVVFMLLTGAAALMGFYSFVEFGRLSYDGLGPRYELPVVVALAPGTAAFLSPLLLGLGDRGRAASLRSLSRSFAPGVLAASAAFLGVFVLAPFVLPVARTENEQTTAPLRAARALGLKNAIVMLEPPALLTHTSNLAQNAPFDPDAPVLFLTRSSSADELCARRHFPGRSWYRVQYGGSLAPYRPLRSLP